MTEDEALGLGQRRPPEKACTPGEFRNKLAAGRQFLRTALEGNKLFLIGDEQDLAKLAS